MYIVNAVRIDTESSTSADDHFSNWKDGSITPFAESQLTPVVNKHIYMKSTGKPSNSDADYINMWVSPGNSILIGFPFPEGWSAISSILD